MSDNLTKVLLAAITFLTGVLSIVSAMTVALEVRIDKEVAKSVVLETRIDKEIQALGDESK